MPTPGEKDFMAETGGDLTAEQAQARLTYAALEDAIKLNSRFFDALRRVEYVAGKKVVNFDLPISNLFAETPKGWLKAIHQNLLDIKQEYEEEDSDGLD